MPAILVEFYCFFFLRVWCRSLCWKIPSLFPAALHSFQIKLLGSLQAKGQRHRCALIRWKLIAVNSLNQMWQGFEPFKETLRSWKKTCSQKRFCLNTYFASFRTLSYVASSLGLLSNFGMSSESHYWWSSGQPAGAFNGGGFNPHGSSMGPARFQRLLTRRFVDEGWDSSWRRTSHGIRVTKRRCCIDRTRIRCTLRQWHELWILSKYFAYHVSHFVGILFCILQIFASWGTMHVITLALEPWKHGECNRIWCQGRSTAYAKGFHAYLWFLHGIHRTGAFHSMLFKVSFDWFPTPILTSGGKLK